MDEYDKKFAEMQKYVPFLEAMIERLQNVKDKSREVQLQKMQSLHGILSNSKRKLKIETLQRCEDVLLKLHNKVEKFQGNTPGLHFPNKKGDTSSAQPTIVLTDAKSGNMFDDAIEERDIHETPASPSPPVSPESGSQVEPIIIPTERSADFDFALDSKPASPDIVETLPTKAPIIIPTERASNDDFSPSHTVQHRPCKGTGLAINEWDLLEENENQTLNSKNWHEKYDIAQITKTGINTLCPKVTDAKGHAPMSMHSSRQISAPVTPLNNCRRQTSIVNINRLTQVNSDQQLLDTKTDSPAHVTDTMLRSPNSDIPFSKHGKNSTPSLKDSTSRHNSKPTAALLLSPPPVSMEPPLSMEDLAELLNENDNKVEKKNDRLTENQCNSKKSKQELCISSRNIKDSRAAKSFLLTQEDIDSESERRWEEIDKHIVKLTSRKCLPTSSNATLSSKVEVLKCGEMKSALQDTSGHNTSVPSLSTLIENKNQPLSPGSKTDSRLTDNYERHSRQLRENYGHDKDKHNMHHSHCRPEDDMSNQISMQHGSHQRRQGSIGADMILPRADAEFRMEGQEYFNRQASKQGHWSSIHGSSINQNDFCNNQWSSAPNFNGVSNSPAQPYQHSLNIHRDMWNVGLNREPIHIDPHQMNEGQLRHNQFGPNINTCIRSLMSPNTRSKDMNHITRSDEIPNSDVSNAPVIQPLISPTRFSVGQQYRSFQGDTRSYDVSFDRGMEYTLQRQPWESPVNRSNDISYRDEVLCGAIGSTEGSGPYSRPSTPCPWNRDRDRGGGRGRTNYYNDRTRGEARTNFPRDIRRPEWTRDNHNEWESCTRFSRDTRNISERDPRVRLEYNVTNQNLVQMRDNNHSARDPRLIKDKHYATAKNKDPGFNERDPRKRNTSAFSVTPFRKIKDKTKSSPKAVDTQRRTDVELTKQTQEKTTKEKVPSPLESLYGVIDTKAKSSQGYCLQNFKIPKIKRNDFSESPSSSQVVEDVKESSEDKQESRFTKKGKEDATAEVTSSSDGTAAENWNESNLTEDKKKELKEDNTFEKSAKDKNELSTSEADSISTTIKIESTSEKSKKEEAESEELKPKDEVTQEWIEALIRKSFECGEGKKFVEQAKFMHKLGEVLQAKKLKKIKKIIESESESSNSDEDDDADIKSLQSKKKRRAIVSDSSDDESLDNRSDHLNEKTEEACPHSSLNTQKDEKQNIVAKESTQNEVSSYHEKDETVKKDTNDFKVNRIISETEKTLSEEKEQTNSDANADKEEITSEAPIEEQKEDKLIAFKTPKTKAKRRNSLEMLQEDIREMFISDDVVAATGHRQCRTQKENQSNIGIGITNQSVALIKKDDLTKSEVDIDSNTENVVVVTHKQKRPSKSRNFEELAKSKGKVKNEVQRVTRQRTKQCNQSSDSEEDQPLALRSELIQNVSSSPNEEQFNDDSEVLRRSKRIVNKETVKETNVIVEKKDELKIESTKVMFDSSSDESFGIDVSELAAAVDVSLHPEKQPEPRTVESTEEKGHKNISKKLSKNKCSDISSESKDTVQFTDEESILSNTSMSSSITSAKKLETSSGNVDISANEELLSNILVGLVQSQTNVVKDLAVMEKTSDVDLDDDISDHLPVETNAKKSSAKKKKKKCNWQMGILSKKKRKKISSASSPKQNSDGLNTNSKMEDSSNSENAGGKISNQDIEQKDRNNVTDNTILDNTLKQQKNEEPTEKKDSLNLEATSVESSDAKDEKAKEKAILNVEKSALKNKEEVDKAFYDLDIKQLIDYAWIGQERYKCLLCFFTGKNIVHHYKSSHPGKEILISRLKVTDAQLAAKDAEDKEVENTSLKPRAEDIIDFHCRFCSFSTEGDVKAALEIFYEHCTTHTGEYRFRCNNCPYQAVAKSSMRTHYYKVCRKSKETFAEAITEDDIPEENAIYGYLCSNCNYVQLKKNNVKDHLQLWHEDDLSVKIIKINMSLSKIEKESDNVTMSKEKAKEKDLEVNLAKEEGSATTTVASVEEEDNPTTEMEFEQNAKIINDKSKNVEAVLQVKAQNDLSKSKDDNNKKEKSLPKDTDTSLPSGNLSVFVCPPDLEKKEVEIQLERKKKMQEIIQNIGIKLQKDASKKDLSIIDKLKDKMQTNTLTMSDATNLNLISNSPNKMKNDSTNVLPNATSVQHNVVEMRPTCSAPITKDLETASHPVQDTIDDKLTKQTTSTSQSSTVEGNTQSIDEVSDRISKVPDPLTKLNQSKNEESDAEVSDSEGNRNTASIYESDTSSEHSDAELPADVNMILKETCNIHASSKDPMLTTIQRLAAQLQATKPLEDCKDVSSKTELCKRTFSLTPIPNPPDVVPITSIKRFVGKAENKFHEISSEEHNDSDEPKNFIRLRRLSGDMLSVPMQSSEVQECLAPTISHVSQFSSLDKKNTSKKPKKEEECSFLKIENVVSLAPTVNNDGTENLLINDIRKAVEVTSLKNRGVSVLKNPKSPLILKRLNAVTLSQTPKKNTQTIEPAVDTVKIIPVKNLPSVPVTVATTQLTTNFIPIVPSSKIIHVDNKLSFPLSTNKNTTVSSVNTRTVAVTTTQASNLSYKILKVVRTPTILKPKEQLKSPTALKLKSADAYNAMLKAPKLIQLYKCMARECRYTTDVLNHFHQHYVQHMNDAEKKKIVAPFDYQKCAYCYMVLDDWNQMKMHIEEKHAHCRYQCVYCFYRAVAPSYVQIHQAINHSGNQGILLGKLVKELPVQEEIDRHDCVYPYVCQHDCGKFFYVPESFVAHLKSKHGSTLSSYKCHVCRATSVRIEHLLTHYKMHGFYKYQCMYCLNGADTIADIHSHLSVFHCNRLPQVLERALPVQPVRNKDVIDQLVIRTLDESFKSTEEMIDVGKNKKETKIVLDIITPSSTQNLQASQLPKAVTMFDKEDNEDQNKSLITLFGTKSTSSSSFNISLPRADKALNESCNDNATDKIFGSFNDPEISVTSVLRKTPRDSNDFNKSNTSNIIADGNSVEPLDALNETFDCSDEFININILDNPDFLIKVSNQSNDKSATKTTARIESKMEDSDIEILDIDDSETTSTNTLKTDIQINASNNGHEQTRESQEKDTKKEEFSNDENSCSTETKNSFTCTSKADKPMTLEDIKDTGFSGTNLYVCGNEKCDFRTQSAVNLRIHLKDCNLCNDDNYFNCAHCNKRFLKIGFLLEHLRSHGLKRFGCSMCKMRCTVGYQAIAHMKTKHRYAYSKLIPADPKNPSVDGLFIVQPVRQNNDRKGKKRKNNTKPIEKECEKVMLDNEKFSFSPDEIDSLPRQAIYNKEVQCAVCPYTTKVRMNIIRHLQLHAKDESVPESGPVNPVPCLDKKERMFDKMVNLASSSHQNGRMGNKQKEFNKDNDNDYIPKFIPEHKRYVCGVAECNYLTVDEAMLRCHLKALHSEEQYFRCPHCPQLSGQEAQNIAIDKMGIHLKMHDARLYKCSHCNHHHYHRHVVERHLSDKHPEKRPFVKVIRELENTESTQQPVQEEIEEELPDPDGNHWKCNICDYKCVYKAEMVNHTTVTHDEKCQYKCTLCSFKTNGKIMFEQHMNSKHFNDTNVDYILTYQRIKGVNKKATEYLEASGQEEPFDTTPLWRRDMPRIRHIRGILLEDDEVSTESSSKSGKRKSDVDIQATKPAKIKSGKSDSFDDLKMVKEKSKRSWSCDKIFAETENISEISNTESKPKETKAKQTEDNDFSDSDVGRFGPYGKPDGNMYVCTLCTQFKTKYKHDMRDHLYRELNYARWHCKECGYLSVNRNALLKHFNKHHNGERPNHEPLSPDDDIEEWVQTLLKRQTFIIKRLLVKQNVNSTATVVTDVSERDSKSTTKTAQSDTCKISKNTAVEARSSTTEDSKDEDIEIAGKNNNDVVKSSESMITDVKDVASSRKEHTEKNTNVNKVEQEEDQEKSFICKHCNMTFTRWRGFKLHIQLTHLKRLGFICPYCDRSTNSESLMRQHIRSKHPDCPEKIVENPAAGGPDLPEEFWQQEYGIVFPKKSRKRKRKISGEETTNKDSNIPQVDPQEKCGGTSNITTMNVTGLKAHRQSHAMKSAFKCSYCSFIALTNSEIFEHWKLTHTPSSFKVDEINVPESTDVLVEGEKNKTVDDYSDYIEEEQVTDVKKQKESIYYCFYCSFRSKTIDAVQNHWSIIHNELASQNDVSKTKLCYPFRYKEIKVSPEKSYLKSQDLKMQAENPYELYLQSQSDIHDSERVGSKVDGWICQWCNELCDSEGKIKTHHSMFHSHLPLNFKKQKKDNIPKGYACPECSFVTTFINVMKNHVLKHIDLFKCKHCGKTFNSSTHISSHNLQEHPDMEMKIESIQNHDALVEKIMAKVQWQKSEEDTNTNKIITESSKKVNAVAKKSTARNAFRPNIISYRVKAVARKSTNPHSRYSHDNKSSSKQTTKSKGFSYYGIPRSPVNLAKLNTYMVVGGHRMKVNCTTLAQLININPVILLNDLKYDIKSMVTLKKLK